MLEWIGQDRVFLSWLVRVIVSSVFCFVFVLTKGTFEAANQDLDTSQRVYVKNMPPLVDKERIHLQLQKGKVIASLAL